MLTPQLLVLTFGVITLAFMLLLATAPDLGSLEVSGGSDAVAPAEPAPSPAGPTWLREPLVTPLPEAGPLR
jgi:hypothetical protein